MSYTRTLAFRSSSLGKDANLVLVFDNASDGLYNKFPVVWKAATFGARGQYHFRATFSSQLAWLKPAISMDSIVDSSAYTLIDYNQKTTLQQDGGMLSFTPPETGTPGSVTVVNGTHNRQDIALGLLRQEGFMPEPVYYWSGFEASQNIQTNFQPVLRAYITSHYREGQIVRGEISTPPIFEQNLSTLDGNTTWNLGYNPVSGRFSITQA